MKIDDRALAEFIGMPTSAPPATATDVVKWLYTPVDSAGREARRRLLGEWLVEQIEK
jgi:hypothetical protein